MSLPDICPASPGGPLVWHRGTGAMLFYDGQLAEALRERIS